MPKFRCSVCDDEFHVPQTALDRYANWQPKYCREHSPSKPKSATQKKSSGGKRGGSRREQNLRLDQVLERYHDGPSDGVFTDGSAIPNPGPGGWGVVHVQDGEVIDSAHGSSPATTNNRMELQALIEAYRRLPVGAEVVVHSDSRLCVDTITKWASGWERRGWKRKGGEIKNLEMVQELYALYQARPLCKLQWIAAHNGYRWNEYADSLATAWMRDEL